LNFLLLLIYSKIKIYPNKSPKPPASSSSTTGFFSSFLGAAFLSSFFSAGAAAWAIATAATADDNLGNPRAINYQYELFNHLKIENINYMNYNTEKPI